MNKIILLTFISLSVISCKKELKTKPHGSTKAVSVYNHAYQENYEKDKLETIIEEATNAYVLIDPFEENSHLKINDIKLGGNEVGGYISIGTTEDWRTDHEVMSTYCVDKVWGNWKGEYFVNSTTTGVIEIIKSRIDQMAEWGLDWVEFDNMDWAFDDDNRKKYGFTVTKDEAIVYYQTLCNYVHQKGMKCLAKNVVEGCTNFDGVLCESYTNNKDWWDHNGVQNFLDSGKLVIINHYNEKKPNRVYQEYIDLYTSDISYICESKKEKKYIHYNQ